MEPRVLLSADALGIDAGVLDPDASEPLSDPDLPSAWVPAVDSQSETATTDTHVARQEIVFLDAGVDNGEQLLSDLTSGDGVQITQVYLIDTATDGIDQVSAALAAHQGIDAVHIISHGAAGQIQLGSATLSTGTLEGYADQLNGWGSGLTASGDILIYGCDLAADEQGRALVDAIGIMTGADVAASVDQTGAASQGGDWDLEYRVGAVNSAVFSPAAHQGWQGSLATFTVDDISDTVDAVPGDGSARDAMGNTTLRAAINEANALGGSHTIILGAGNYDLTIIGSGEDVAATGDLDINADITLSGAGAASTVIDASGFGGNPDRVFHVLSGRSLTLTDLTLQGGEAGSDNGGAVRVEGTLTADRVIMTGNGADDGGAIYSSGTVMLTDSVLTLNDVSGTGGGLRTTGGTAALDRVEVSYNTALQGGGLYHDAPSMDLTNVTVSHNTATADGGGIYTWGSVTALNSTIAFNDGDDGAGTFDIAGVRTQGSGGVTLTNTILHNPLGENASSGFADGGSNIISDTSAGFGLNSDPLLGALADNGGYTQTHALLVGSPAIDAGNNTGAPAVDQRGTGRPVDGNLDAIATVDIGAYEYEPTLIAYEPFDYNVGSLETLNGGTGWANGWLTSAPNSALVATDGLTGPTGDLSETGRAAEMDTLGQFRQARDLDTPIGADNTTAWVSFLLKPEGLGAEGLSLELGAGGTTIGYYQNDFLVTRDGTTTGAAWINDVVVDQQTYLLTARLDFAAGNDTVTLYVDPTPGQAAPDSVSTIQLTTADLGTFTSIGLVGGFFGNNSQLDEIRIGASFEDVVPTGAGPITNAQPTVSGTYTAAATDEDTIAAPVNIGSMLGDAAITQSEPDGDTLGVAVVATLGNGAWEYSTNGASGWTSFGTVSVDAALLLSDSTWVRYVPDSSGAETPGFDFRAWDQTADSASGNGAGNRSYGDTEPAPATGAYSSTNAAVQLSVTELNDEPTLTTTASAPAFTGGGAAVGLFSGTGVDTVESGQTLSALTLQVTNVLDGGDEILTIDGNQIALSDGTSGTTGGHGLGFSVSVTGSTATVALTGGTLTTAEMSSLVDAITYQHNSGAPSVGDRVVTITALTDSGGTADGGVDTASLSAASTVTVQVNSATLWLSTDEDASDDNATAIGKEDIASFSNPDLALEMGDGSGTTDGTLNVEHSLPNNVRAMHYVNTTVTVDTYVGGVTGSHVLQPGQIVVALISGGNVPKVGGGTLTVDNEDVLVYDPGSGEYRLLLEDAILKPNSDPANIHAVSIVEQATTIGEDTELTAGTYLVAHSDPGVHANIVTYDNTNGQRDLLLGVDYLADATRQVQGLELLEADLIVGGQLLTEGTLLVSFEDSGAETVGNGVTATVEAVDIVALTVKSTELDSVTPDTDVEARILFDGSDISLAVSGGKEINGLTLFGNDLAAANTAPSVSDATLAAVDEDDVSPAGETVDSLFSASFVDPDSGSGLWGIAVIGNPENAAQGTWEYATDSTNWAAIGTVADDNTALVLSAATEVRFVPTGDYNGDPDGLTVRAIDDTFGGSASDTTGGTETRETTDAALNGGSTPLAGETTALDVTVNAVDDNPVFTATGAFSVDENSAVGTSVGNVDANDGEAGYGVPNLLFTEIMYAPNSPEHDWEWIELYNAGSEAVDLGGWVLDDNNGDAHGGANISAGTIAAGETAILYNADDVLAADFQSAWGGGLNLIAVTGWSSLPLDNDGDTVSLWASFVDYSGDDIAHANAAFTLTYDDIGAWPAPDGFGSIYLTDLAADPGIGSNWAPSTVGATAPFGNSAFESVAAGSNTGADVGSPDAGNTGEGVTYTITANVNPDADGDDAFAIDPLTGEITVNDMGDLNFENNASFLISVEADDGTSTSTTDVAINLNDVNDDPAAVAGGGYGISEGDDLAVDASGSGDIDGSIVAYHWDLNNDLDFSDLTTVSATPTFDWATLVAWGLDEGSVAGTSYTIGLQVEDNLGGTDETTTTVTIDDVAPKLMATGTGSVTAGVAYTLNLSATDPGNDSITAWTINWGDGAVDTYNSNPASVTHTYDNAGFTYNVKVAATDGDGTWHQAGMIVANYDGADLSLFAPGTGDHDSNFANGDGLSATVQSVIGPDGMLYVSGESSGNVLRYNPATLAFDIEFIAAGSNGLGNLGGIAFGPDGHLYVADYSNHRVMKFDAANGDPLGTFVGIASGGLNQPYGMLFGPDGDLYVASYNKGEVYRYDGETGDFVDIFVTSADNGGLNKAEQMAFGKNGHLYIASYQSNEILRFDGTSGAFMGDFVAAGGAEDLDKPVGLAFGPDGRLYVTDSQDDLIFRYDPDSGVYLDTYADSGMDEAGFITFLPAHQVDVIAAANVAPTLTQFTAPITTGDEDAEIEVSFAQLEAQGDEADSDGSVDAFIVKTVSSGTLKIGANPGAATAWIAGANDRIDGSNNAYWTPYGDANGTLNAFDVVARDDDGADSSNNVTAQITVNAVNDLPTADGGGPHVISEGGTLSLDGSASSDSDGTVSAWAWDIGNNGSFEKSGATTSFDWSELNAAGVDDDGLVDVALQVTDDSGGETTQVFQVQIDNVAPTISVTGSGVAVANNSYTLNLSATDPGNELITGWVINWGDGTVDNVSGDPGPVTHTYKVPGLSYQVTVAVIDEDGTHHQSDLLVTDSLTDSVMRFDPVSGTFLQAFADGGEINVLGSAVVGPDGLLYVTGDSNNVVRYDVGTGARVDAGDFVGSGAGLDRAEGMAFGPNGNLFVVSFNTGEILEFDGSTGASLGAFASGLSEPHQLLFGTDGNLLVTSGIGDSILQLDGETGAVLSTFVTSGDGGLDEPRGMALHNGVLYVVSRGSDSVIAYSALDGSLIGDAVPTGYGGLVGPMGVTIGPDGDIYVASLGVDSIKQYDGVSGAYLGDFVASGEGGLDRPNFMVFGPSHQVSVVSGNAPVFQNSGPFTVDENAAALIPGGDVDADDGDGGAIDAGITYRIITNANPDGDGNQAFGIDASTGVITVNDSGDLDYEANNTLVITVEADDGLLSSSTDVTINLNPVNDNDPVADDESFTLVEGGTATEADLDVGTSLLDGDTDADAPNDTLTVNTTPAAGPSHGTVLLNDNGTFSYTHDGSENFTDSFSYELLDADGGVSDTGTVTITITPVNENPPVLINPIPDQSATEDLAFSFQFSALAFDDPDIGEVLGYTASQSGGVALPSWLSFDAANRTFSGTPLDADVGVLQVTVTATDAVGAQVSDTFEITVNAVNDLPTLGNNRLVLTQGEQVTLNPGDLSATDIDNADPTLRFTLSSVVGGQFELLSSPGVAIFSFTQAQLAGGQVVFVDDGDEVAPAYAVSVGDGAATTGPSASHVSFSLNATSSIAPVIAVDTSVPVVLVPPVNGPAPLPEVDDDAAPGPEASSDPAPDEEALPEEPVEVGPGTDSVIDTGLVADDRATLSDRGIGDEIDTPKVFVAEKVQGLLKELFVRPAAFTAASLPALLPDQFEMDELASEVRAVLASGGFRSGLDQMRDEISDATAFEQTLVGSTAAVTTGLSVGYVAWLVRGGVLLSTALSSLPAWQFVDPLPVLARTRGGDDDEGDSLESIIKEESDRADNRSGPASPDQVPDSALPEDKRDR